METRGAIFGVPVTFAYDESSGDLKWRREKGIKSNAVADEGVIKGAEVWFARKPENVDGEDTFVVFVNTVSPDSPIDAAVPDVVTNSYGLTSPPGKFVERFLLKELPEHLRVGGENLHFIVSSKAGTERADAFFEEILKVNFLPFLGDEGEGKDYQVLRVKSAEDVYEYAKAKLRIKAAEGVQQTVVLLSGDGGVSDVLNGIGGVERMSKFIKPTILLFPFGTGNALYHSLAPPSPSPLHQSLRTLISPAPPRPLPHFTATFSAGKLILPSTTAPAPEIPLPRKKLYGCIVASYGFHSTLVAASDRPELRKYGAKRFQMVAEQLLERPHRYQAPVLLSGPIPASERRAESPNRTRSRSPYQPVPTKEWEIQRLHHAYIVCTLVSHLERTFTISPASKPFDHKLRIVHFDSESGEEIMDIMKEGYDGGRHVQREKVGYQEIESCRIEFEDEDERFLRVCVDGLIVRVERLAWLKVQVGRRGEEVLGIVI